MQALIILLLGLRIAFAAQTSDTPTFRTGVSVVRVDAQVVLGDRILMDLGSDDFIVYDEDAPQKISYFGRERESVSLLLLLDVSGSMQEMLGQMASKSRQAMRHLQRGDRIGVMLFSRRTRVAQEFSADVAGVAGKLDETVKDDSLGSATEINASILTASHYAQEGGAESGRRSILIVTDNRGLNYQLPDELVLRGLFTANTVLNAIVVGKGRRPDKTPPGVRSLNPDFTPSDVYTLAEETGGEAIQADRPDAAFQQMIERIRARYSLHYTAPDAKSGEFRRIRVALSPEARRRYPDARVRARSGYYAGN